jgi:hypothetical protein
MSLVDLFFNGNSPIRQEMAERVRQQTAPKKTWQTCLELQQEKERKAKVIAETEERLFPSLMSQDSNSSEFLPFD